MWWSLVPWLSMKVWSSVDNPTRTELQSSTLHSTTLVLWFEDPGARSRWEVLLVSRSTWEWDCDISSQRPLDFFDMCGRNSGEGPLLLRSHFVTLSLPEGSLDCIHSRTDLETTRTSGGSVFQRSQEGTSLVPSTTFNKDSSQAPGWRHLRPRDNKNLWC